MVVLQKGRLGNHKTVAKTAEMGCIFHFFCENVAGIDLSRDVHDVHLLIVVELANLVFAKVKVFDTL